MPTNKIDDDPPLTVNCKEKNCDYSQDLLDYNGKNFYITSENNSVIDIFNGSGFPRFQVPPSILYSNGENCVENYVEPKCFGSFLGGMYNNDFCFENGNDDEAFSDILNSFENDLLVDEDCTQLLNYLNEDSSSALRKSSLPTNGSQQDYTNELDFDKLAADFIQYKFNFENDKEMNNSDLLIQEKQCSSPKLIYDESSRLSASKITDEQLDSINKVQGGDLKIVDMKSGDDIKIFNYDSSTCPIQLSVSMNEEDLFNNFDEEIGNGLRKVSLVDKLNDANLVNIIDCLLPETALPQVNPNGENFCYTNHSQPRVATSCLNIGGVSEVVSDEVETISSRRDKYSDYFYCSNQQPEKQCSSPKLIYDESSRLSASKITDEQLDSINKMQRGEIKIVDMRGGDITICSYDSSTCLIPLTEYSNIIQVTNGESTVDEDMETYQSCNLSQKTQVIGSSINYIGFSSSDKLMAPRPPQEFPSAHRNITSEPYLPLDCQEMKQSQMTKLHRNGPLVVQKPFNVASKPIVLSLDVNQLANKFRPMQVEDNPVNRQLKLMQFQEYLQRQMEENGIVEEFSNFNTVMESIFSKGQHNPQLARSVANSARKRPSSTTSHELDRNMKVDEALLSVLDNSTCVSPSSSLETNMEHAVEDATRQSEQTMCKPKRQRTSKPQPSDREPEKMINLLKERAPRVFSHVHKIVHHYLINLLCHKASFELDLVRWEDFDKLQFYVSGPKVVARVWAMLKRNSSDDWENFARGIRNSRTRGFFLDSGTTRKKVFRLSQKAVDDFFELSRVQPNFYVNCAAIGGDGSGGDEIDSHDSLVSPLDTSVCHDEDKDDGKC